MSKSTNRIWRKKHNEIIAKRIKDEREAKVRRLGGFKPATRGEMLAELSRHGYRGGR